jgi:hypothetical protein
MEVKRWEFSKDKKKSRGVTKVGTLTDLSKVFLAVHWNGWSL